MEEVITFFNVTEKAKDYTLFSKAHLNTDGLLMGDRNLPVKNHFARLSGAHGIETLLEIFDIKLMGNNR